MLLAARARAERPLPSVVQARQPRRERQPVEESPDTTGQGGRETDPGKPAGKCHRNTPPMAEPLQSSAQARLKWCGKSAPASRRRGGWANPTRCKAKQDRSQAARRGPGRPQRWMAVHDRIRLTGLLRKSPAYAGFFYGSRSRELVTVAATRPPAISVESLGAGAQLQRGRRTTRRDARHQTLQDILSDAPGAQRTSRRTITPRAAPPYSEAPATRSRRFFGLLQHSEARALAVRTLRWIACSRRSAREDNRIPTHGVLIPGSLISLHREPRLVRHTRRCTASRSRSADAPQAPREQFLHSAHGRAMPVEGRESSRRSFTSTDRVCSRCRRRVASRLTGAVACPRSWCRHVRSGRARARSRAPVAPAPRDRHTSGPALLDRLPTARIDAELEEHYRSEFIVQRHQLRTPSAVPRPTQCERRATTIRKSATEETHGDVSHSAPRSAPGVG